MRSLPAALLLALLPACGSEEPFVGTSSDRNSARDGGTDPDDDEPEPSADDPDDDADDDDDDDPEPSANPRPDLDPGSPACEPESGRCDDFGDERPDRLSEHSAVYDPNNRQMIVFGGTPSIPVNCGPGPVEFVDELWLYDDPCGQWQQLENTGPSARGRHMATFGDGQMFVFGGRFREGARGFYVLYNELWSFDVESLSWTELSPGDSRPTARVSGVLLYDAGRSRLWLVGGNQSEDGAAYFPTNDVWSYSLDEQSWQQHNSSIGPEPRLFHTAVLDAARDRLVIFGGADETAFSGINGYFSDLWALDLSTLEWERLGASSAAPQGRFWGRMVLDPDTDTYLFFGGHDDAALGNRNDTWRFDPETDAWAQLASEDTHQNDANGVCDFPPDFAAIDPSMPERRNAHTLVWSEPCNHALLFAGKTDCGSTDDIWRWSDGTWTPRLLAREGEVCTRWRPSPADCTDMCF